MKRNFLLLVGTVMAAVHGCHSEIEPSVKIETAKNSTIQLPQNSTESEANSNSAAQAKEHVDNKGDWPLFRGNAESQGVATSSLPKKLDEIWKYEIKDGAFEGSPIIAGEKDKTVYIGDADGRVLAFNLNDGKVRWEVKTEWGFASSPAFQNGRIYIGDVDGKFYCFNEKGDKEWESKAEDSIDSSANFYKDLVLFGSRDARLYALHAETGKPVWQMETDDQVRCSITVADGKAFVAGCDGALHIVDLDEGKEVGNVPIESPTGVTPAANDGFVYVGTEQSGFYSIDLDQQKLKWTYNDSEGAISTRSSPAVTSDHVIFGARNRKVYSINPISGKANWTRVLKGNIDASPVIVGQRVFVGTSNGRLYELELQTGKIIWEKQLDGGLIASPAVGFGRLIIATDRGVVYCFGKGN